MDYADGLPLSVGIRLGPYEITAAIGAGGMGEVYRARDTRLSRDVAIKVLRTNLAASPDRLRRFSQEARAASALNHPNILVIYDIGTHNGSPYIVSEFLVGETVEQRLRTGPLPIRAAISYAVQIAAGLAAAHEKGIVHRDLKPANVFLTSAGGLKILDFGLAKLLPSGDPPLPNTTTATLRFETPPEHVVGTPSYMSPEQVRADAIDHRSDIFSFGAVFYEMLTGRRAFLGSSQVETMNMVLAQDPPPLDDRIAAELSPAIGLILRRCLEKQRDERFESARDLGFSLSAIGDSLSSAGRESRLRVASRRDFLLAGGVALPAAAAGFLIGRVIAPNHVPHFQRLTFRRGSVYSARFAADGRTIVYAAAWEDGPLQVYSVRPESPESATIGFPGARLLAVSPTGELALALGYHYVSGFIYSGMLAQAPMAGGAPREMASSVEWADWTPTAPALPLSGTSAGKAASNFLSTPLFTKRRDGSATSDSLPMANESVSSNIRLMAIMAASLYPLTYPGKEPFCPASSKPRTARVGHPMVRNCGSRRLVSELISICTPAAHLAVNARRPASRGGTQSPISLQLVAH
jgi:serine/threonine protein kinase